MFLMSLASIVALGVIAGGSFWIAESMYHLTDNTHRVSVILATPTTPVALPPGVTPYTASIP